MGATTQFSQDLLIILFLAVLETVLSLDNALVMALIARDLPREQQKKALTYGLLGAVAFRLTAIWLMTRIIQWTWIKFVGGAYLLWIGFSHLLRRNEKKNLAQKGARSLWKAVLFIELSDIAFALDSIIAAVALSKRFWIIFTGGFIGLLMIRIASGTFIKLLAKYPSFEKSAYLMVLIVGIKLSLEGFHFEAIDFQSSGNPAFWIFWLCSAACIALGFKKPTTPVSQISHISHISNDK